MLFLLDTDVISVPTANVTPPEGFPSFRRLPKEAVIPTIRAIFEEHPRLERDRPEVAVWLCSVLMDAFPGACAALFYRDLNTDVFIACVADVPIHLVARLWRFQRDGLEITDEVYRMIWSRAKFLG